MTQTANVPAPEPVSRIPRETVRLDPQPEMLPCEAPLLYEGVSDSLIPCRQIKKPHCRGIALDAAITLRAEHAGAPDQKPHASGQCPDVSAYASRETSRARALGCTDLYGSVRKVYGFRAKVYGFRMLPVGLGTVLRCDQSTHNVGKAFLVSRGQRRAIEQREDSAPPRLPASGRQEPKKHGQRLLHPALAGPGDVPTMALLRHYQQCVRHLCSDYHVPAKLPACCPRNGCTIPVWKEGAIARTALVRVSGVLREAAALGNGLEPDCLPAGAVRMCESIGDRRFTPLACRRDDRRRSRRQPEAAIAGNAESTQGPVKPFAWKCFKQDAKRGLHGSASAGTQEIRMSRRRTNLCAEQRRSRQS